MKKGSSPRVCIIRRAYYPAESHVRRNAETLVQAGYAVGVICLRNCGESAREVVDGVSVYRLPLRTRRAGVLRYIIEYSIFFLMASVAVTWLHIRHSYAVVEADSMPDFLVFAGLIPRLSGARVILYLFESMPEMWAQKRRLSMAHWAVRFLCWTEHISCGFADRVICCHEMARLALVGRGVPEGKIIVVLNVPDERVFRSDVCRATTDNHGALRLIQHGTITENYGIQIVLRALQLLVPTLPVHFDIVGDGEYRRELQSLTEELGLQNYVTFHGFVSRERLLELLCRAQVGIVPMLLEYQSPNKLFEFVALGKPVIASDLETFRQHFSENEICYFRRGDPHDLARVIERAVQQPSRTHEFAQRAMERYNCYRWARMSQRYLGVYNELLATRGRKL